MAKLEIKEFFEGKKTYVTTVAILCYALGGWVAGLLEPSIAIGLILGAFGLGSVRSAISKVLADNFQTAKPPAPGYQ